MYVLILGIELSLLSIFPVRGTTFAWYNVTHHLLAAPFLSISDLAIDRQEILVFVWQKGIGELRLSGTAFISVFLNADVFISMLPS